MGTGVTMVISTDLCALSEYRIYPGNGRQFIRRDGKPIFLGSSKAYSLTQQRKKPTKLVWTQAWRRLHKKVMAETTMKRRTRRITKVARDIVGLSLDDLRKKVNQKNDYKPSQREAALKEIKARKINKVKTTGGRNSAHKGAGQMTKVPKTVMRNTKQRLSQR